MHKCHILAVTYITQVVAVELSFVVMCTLFSVGDSDKSLIKVTLKLLSLPCVLLFGIIRPPDKSGYLKCFF